MNCAKYVVVSSEYSGELMFVFPPTVDHYKMAKSLRKMRLSRVISAGFVDEFMQCFGESMTLRSKSRDIDTYILKSMLGLDDKEIIFEDED